MTILWISLNFRCTDSSTNFSFSFISGVSGTSLFNSVSLMAYNVFYTSVPVLVSVLDKDLSEETVMQHPQILFYCQAGRFGSLTLISLCFFKNTCQTIVHTDCALANKHHFPNKILQHIGQLSLKIYFWSTGFSILAHLLDGLDDPFSM